MSKHYLSGAKWTLKNDSFEYNGTLDDNGRTDLNNIALGTYNFTLSKEGYQTNVSKVVIGNDPINIKAELEPLPKETKLGKTPKTPKKTAKKEAVKEEKPKKETKKEKEPKKETKTKAKSSAKKTSSKKSSKTTKKAENKEVKDKEDKE